MAKSIRSKCKRKARSEFRSTIGNEFYQKNMEKVQAKLKACAETGTMSITTAIEDAMMAGEQTSILKQELAAAKELKGENKAPSKSVHKKSKKGKHTKTTAVLEKKEKKRPRYFVQF
eukprot:jgi/Psemu1/295394/fgenesh1_pm.64_\